MTEKLTSMYSLDKTATGENMLKEVKKTWGQYNLQWNLL